MRSVTLSCITFQWMNTRVHWSFRAVGGRKSPLNPAQPIFFETRHLDFQTCDSAQSWASLWASVEAKPFFFLLAQRSICLRLPSLKPVLIYHSLHQWREELTPVPFSLTALMNYAPSPSLIHALCDVIHCSLAFVLRALMSCLHHLKGIVRVLLLTRNCLIDCCRVSLQWKKL